ncbi:SPX domain-containing protein [Schizophyllum amplum]|uniref:SPX domain-containing protein n=1 Tax=Schizophyllum amplum TaxID=97359 RepID=A0A550BXX2_9AGAR|nr:SPX domain-containing protein [Auriculariopsis ampla]
MHFGKTYAQLLLDLPPELRDNAIQYRQLKKLINQVVRELTALGLSPQVLHDLLDNQDSSSNGKGKQKAEPCTSPHAEDDPCVPRVVYEFNHRSGKIEPRLRLRVGANLPELAPTLSRLRETLTGASHADEVSTIEEAEEADPGSGPSMSLLYDMQRETSSASSHVEEISTSDNTSTVAPVEEEIIIPLPSDTAFFALLCTALESLSTHLESMKADFARSLRDLARSISDTARPVSSSDPKFSPHSAAEHPGIVRVSSAKNASDLYTWRSIFQLYVEAEVFESMGERDRGERDIETAEQRLKLFADQIGKQGLADASKLKLTQSREALQRFLELNAMILNVKKLQYANAEALRKILKKHAKRTALPPVDHEELTSPRSAAMIDMLHNTPSANTLVHLLVQSMTETLLPIIPHLEDYTCLICTDLAFKPIRLACGHLFCVRCLVKMQKRGNGQCPMCRASVVLQADRSNVDWALFNFIEDWFPVEARRKLRANEKEAAEEQLQELGLTPEDVKCVIM